MKSYELKGYLIEVISAEVKTPLHFMSCDSHSVSVVIDLATKISVSTDMPEDEDILDLEGKHKNFIAYFSLTIGVERSVKGTKVTHIFPAGISKCYSEDCYMYNFEKEALAEVLESGLDMMEETFISVESQFLKELNKVW
jgi:hypothetical protein